MTEYVNSVIHLDKVRLSPAYGSVMPLTAGRLMWVWGEGRGRPEDRLQATYSHDQGETWDDTVPLKTADGSTLPGLMAVHLVRMASGALGLIQEVAPGQQFFHVSRDEGETWSSGAPINPPGTFANAAHDVSAVLSDGRILVPVYSHIASTSLLAKPKRLRRFSEDYFGANIACHLRYSYVYYSDDEGETWGRSRNETFVMLENGASGSYSMEEPAVVELKDGRVLMIGRTYLGQHFRSFSNDRGETWTQPEATGLTLVPSPCNVKRIPSTGDLLVIWNQTSTWEYMIGLYRHRLTCAVSKDEGLTWEHHRNLESLDDTAYIEPGDIEVGLDGGYRQPIDRQRYHRAPAPLRYNEPTICFIDDKVVITHSMCVWGDKSVITETYGMDFDKLMEEFGLAPHERGNKVRVMSTDWFYEGQPQ